MSDNSIFMALAYIAEGNRTLKRIIRKREEKRDFAVLVMPENNEELNGCAIKYLDDYCGYNYIKELYVVTSTNPNVSIPSTACNGRCKIKYINIKEEKMRAIIHFCAVFYAPYLCVISLDRPYGRNEHLMIGHKNLTLGDIVCRCLYNLKEIPIKEEKI